MTRIVGGFMRVQRASRAFFSRKHIRERKGRGVVPLIPTKEMPSMEKLYQQLKGEDFEILAVSIDKKGAEAVLPFMKKHNLSFTALIDAKESLHNKYQTTGVPETFIIDRNGIIVEKVIGPRDWASPDAIGFFQHLIPKN